MNRLALQWIKKKVTVWEMELKAIVSSRFFVFVSVFFVCGHLTTLLGVVFTCKIALWYSLPCPFLLRRLWCSSPPPLYRPAEMMAYFKMFEVTKGHRKKAEWFLCQKLKSKSLLMVSFPWKSVSMMLLGQHREWSSLLPRSWRTNHKRNDLLG